MKLHKIYECTICRGKVIYVMQIETSSNPGKISVTEMYSYAVCHLRFSFLVSATWKNAPSPLTYSYSRSHSLLKGKTYLGIIGMENQGLSEQVFSHLRRSPGSSMLMFRRWSQTIIAIQARTFFLSFLLVDSKFGAKYSNWSHADSLRYRQDCLSQIVGTISSSIERIPGTLYSKAV